LPLFGERKLKKKGSLSDEEKISSYRVNNGKNTFRINFCQKPVCNLKEELVMFPAAGCPMVLWTLKLVEVVQVSICIMVVYKNIDM
jgi:hypothetical protein